jgi:hypothetical protein
MKREDKKRRRKVAKKMAKKLREDGSTCLCSCAHLPPSCPVCLGPARAPVAWKKPRTKAIQNATAAHPTLRDPSRRRARHALLSRAATHPTFPSTSHRLAKPSPAGYHTIPIPYHPAHKYSPPFSPRLVISHHLKTPEPDSILRRPLFYSRWSCRSSHLL